MATLQVGYRVTIFATGSEDTSWTPSPTADHAEPFQITTLISGSVAGFAPYMSSFPKGRKSKFDPIKKKLDIGQIQFNVLDKRLTVGGSNEIRWASSFLGDHRGRVRTNGLKVYVEETIDGGSTWLPFYVGRVRGFELDGKLEYKITVKEDNDLQHIIEVFVGEPTGSTMVGSNAYGNRHQVMPWGPDIGYGGLGSRPKPIGTWKAAVTNRNRAIVIDANNPLNALEGITMISKPLQERLENNIGIVSATRVQTEGKVGPICRVTQGATVGRFYITYATFFHSLADVASNTPYHLHSILLEPIDKSLFEFKPLSAFADGSTVSFQILLDEEPSKNVPVLISNVHPVQLWKDCLLGYHSQLDSRDGTALFSGSVELDVPAFQTLIDDGRYKTARFVIDKTAKLDDFVEKEILNVWNLGYRMEPTESNGRAFSKVVPFRMDLPSSLSGLPTITQDMLIDSARVKWKPGEPFLKFETIWYTERVGTLANMFASNAGQEGQSIKEGPQNPTLMSGYPIIKRTLDLSNINAGDKNFKIDAKGIRSIPTEFHSDPEQSPFVIYRSVVMQELACGLHENNVFRWSRGPATIPLKTQRTGSLDSVKVGEYAILDVDWLPDSTTHRRGGARLGQCISRTEEGPTINFIFIDSGANIARTAPTVGDFAQIGLSGTASGNVSNAQSNSIEMQFAVTEQSIATRPDETASLWRFSQRFELAAEATESVFLGNLSAGARIWPRARSHGPADVDLQLPSDWTFPPSDFFDTTGTGPPTNLTVRNITAVSADFNWTNGDLTSSIEIKLQADSSASALTVAVMQPGTTNFTLVNLSTAASENPYEVTVRHNDPSVGTISTAASISFSTNAAIQPQAPPLGGMNVLNDGTKTIPLL